MRILLCAATEMEIAPTLQALSHREEHQVKLLITGVGLMASTYSLTKELVTTRPDMVVQAGVAGTLDWARPLSQVVVVKHESVGDLGVLENGSFRSLFDMKLLSADSAPWHSCRLPNTHAMLGLTELPVVDGVTVNEISTQNETIAYYRDQLEVQIETMEGAALHYVALLEKIPFLQIRSLSNFIGERDKAKWQMKEAITALNRELQRILVKLETL